MKICCGHCGCTLAIAQTEGEIKAAIKAAPKVGGSPCCGGCKPDALDALHADNKAKSADFRPKPEAAPSH